MSAISQLGRVYSQNHKDIDAYYEAIDAQVLPVERGLSCSDDDLWRRRIIMDIMCRGHLDLAAASGQDDPERVFARELPQLRQLQAMGLLQLADGCLTVMEQGWFFVRAIAWCSMPICVQRPRHRASRALRDQPQMFCSNFSFR